MANATKDKVDLN